MTYRCAKCHRKVEREPVHDEGKTYGPHCAVVLGIRPERQIPIKWGKPSGASLSAFRRPPGANARQMERRRGGVQQPASKWPMSPTALPGELMLPGFETEGEP